VQAQTAEREWVFEPGIAGIPTDIAAMTSEAERACYYRLARECAPKGEIVELGAWLGASTAFIAAGIRDSGIGRKAHVYDQFISKPGHLAKVKAFYDRVGIDKVPVGPSLEAFKDNLGPLLSYVEPHQGKIEGMRWDRGPISLLVTDAPKRVPAISAVLMALRDALEPGAIMAWQDFCHFPSYEIPACLYRLRDHLEFVEAVVPGTTLVFRVKSQWHLAEVTKAALALSRWTPEEIKEAWLYWNDFVPPEKFWLFQCGAAMFACDIRDPDWGVALLRGLTSDGGLDAVTTKWRYLKANRPDFLVRYQPLFAYLEEQGAL
jgi:hypothetical protein